MNTNSDGCSNHPEFISIVSAVINDIENLSSNDSTRETDTDTTNSNGTKALTGSVGGILMNRKKHILGLGGTLWSVCNKVDLLLKYFDYIANFVDTILLYMYVFCFDICKLFLKFLILT